MKPAMLPAATPVAAQEQEPTAARIAREVGRELENGYLWLPAEPVSVMEVGGPLWTAVLNSKVVMFYLMGSYLWHFPPEASRGPVCMTNSRGGVTPCE